MPGSEQAQAAAVRAVHVPSPPSEARAWLLAGLIGSIGVAVLVAALSGLLTPARPAPKPPPLVLVAPTPVPGQASARGAMAALGVAPSGARGAAVAEDRGAVGAAADPAGGRARAQPPQASAAWIAGFYPIYATAQSTFGVNWLLLASIHMQESAFSTAPGTYHGLNFAHCCGGPMQFNVTNGPVTTWDLVADSYLYGPRPARYDHRTATHPSIYDDFDAIMAAAHLLSAAGAGYQLDGSAWAAAYDYYGHGREGVAYADEVIARAIGWSQNGFCVECAVRAPLLRATYAAYGAPVLAALTAQQERAAAVRRARSRRRRPARAAPPRRGR